MSSVNSQLQSWIALTRLDKPVGYYLLLWPTYWALWLAADGFPGWKNLIIFTLGVVLMRSAGCVINDFADRKVDGHVKRTAQRARMGYAPPFRRQLQPHPWRAGET